MVYPARQYCGSRTGPVFSIVALAGFALTSTPAGADTLQALYFEPEALIETAFAPTATALRVTAAGPTPFMTDRERAVAIAAYGRAINALQEDKGPFSPELTEQYLALGRLYQEAAAYDKALETYAKAEHLSRMNDGLDAAGQFLPIALSIDCHLAKGAFAEAIERQEYLVYLHREHYGYDAAEAVPTTLALGNMYFEAFERGLRHDPDAPMPAPDYGVESGFADPQDLSPIEIAFLWLDQARVQYFTSIRHLVTHEDYTNPLLLDLETNLIETLFLQAFRRDIEVDPLYFVNTREPSVRDMLSFDRANEQMPSYRAGNEAFTRILSYLRANPAAEPMQVAEAMLELGDWHLLFGREKRALNQYEEARSYLRASGTSEADIAALLSPSVPVQLPVFRAAPHSRARAMLEEQAAYDGYIDVALSLDRTGEVESIEVLDKSANVDSAIEARLKKVLRNAPFRPRLAGEASADKVALRYNFAQL